MAKRIVFWGLMSVITVLAGCTIYTSALATGEKGLNRDRLGWTTIPPEILEDTTLTSLSLFGNKLSSLPEGFRKMQQLEILYLGKNQFRHFPEEICALKSLRILSLAYNEIDSLPDCLCQLEKLEWLMLQNNTLVHLPDSIGKLKNLQQLNLKRNQLRELPDQLYQAHQLQFLDVSYNELQELDTALGQLANLKELRLYRAGFLIQVPESICRLRFLERMNVDQTVVLPTCIFARKTNRLVIQSTDL